MTRRALVLVSLTALALLSQAEPINAQQLPPAPVPVPSVPAPAPAVTPPLVAPAPAPAPPPAAPVWQPAPVPFGVVPPPPPSVGVIQDPRPFLPPPPGVVFGAAAPPPGWFGALEVGLLLPRFRNALIAPVTVANVTHLVAVPSADLDWTGSPRIEIGYRLPEGVGELLVAYRSVVSEGTETLGRYDFLGPGFVRSRLNVNEGDIDFHSGPFAVAPYWDLSWRLGVRVAAAYWDTRARGRFLEQRVSNNFVGAGPHLGLEASRQLDLVPGLAVFGRIEGAVVVGGIDQNFEEVQRLAGRTFGGATRLDGSRTVPMLNILTGISYTPQCSRWLRFALGYQLEQWWGVGDVGASGADLTIQGLFFRGEFNF
jgi:hypothetical protein